MARGRQALALVLLLVLLLGLPLAALPTATAAARPKPHAWHVAVEGVTSFPIDAGGRLSVELPLRLRLGTTFAAIPDAYVDAVNALVVAAGGYGDDTGAIVSDALDSSFVWRLAAGWRPFAAHGFYFELGYALALLGAGAEGQTLFDAAVTIDLPPGAEETYIRRRYEFDSTLHLLTVEVGWEWVLGDAWVIRVAGGMIAAVGSQTRMGYRTRRGGTLEHDEISQAYERWLDDVYCSALFVPTVTVALGLRLF
jgi:hypothetical protein